MPDWGELLVDQLRFMARRDGGEIAYRDMGSGEALTFHEWDARSNAQITSTASSRARARTRWRL